MQKSTDAHSGTYAANLAAKVAVGKFAAGNLFTGSFERSVATMSGKVTFGKDFTYNARPVSASFWMSLPLCWTPRAVEKSWKPSES